MEELTLKILEITREIVPTIIQFEGDSNKKRTTKKLVTKKTTEEIDNILKTCLDNKINIVNYKSEHYPQKLKQFTDAPALLFYQGDLGLLDKQTIGVVGSRQLDDYSTKLMQLTRFHHKVVISGMAYGTDILAHQLSLAQDIPCVAVLPNGLLDHVFYPKAHIKIKDQILENKGLIISQFLPDFQSKKYAFIKRNNLITQLSDIIWVVKAGVKSGSFCTGRLALANKKQVYSTIKDIFDQNYKGNLELIELGAIPLTNLNLITPLDKVYLKQDEQKIVNLILSGINQFDLLLEEVEYIELVESIMRMEAKNILFNNQGEYQVV